MALDWQTIDIPLAAGLDTKTDSRALQPPALSRADNAQFDDVGGIQKRLPYTALPIVDLDGTTITNLRRLATVNDELLLFTKDALYSYASGQSAWVSKGTYLAPKITEQSVFVRSKEQYQCDRAELLGVTIFAWTEDTATDSVWVAAMDSTTGAVILDPTEQAGTGATTRPRLVALSGANTVMLFAADATDGLVVKELDPTDLATGVAASWTVVDSALSNYYDAITDSDDDAVKVVWRRTTTTAYGYATVQTGLGVTKGTKARTCDGPIAIALSANGNLAIIRANGTGIRGDLVSSTYVDSADVDVSVGTASNTPVNQIAAAFSSTEVAGEYDCSVFWSAEEGTGASTEFTCEVNTFSTDGGAGTEGTLVRRAGVASRAFDHDGSVFVWVAFGQGSSSSAVQLQNTYFLFRSDGLLVAKAVQAVGGGHGELTGYLPNVYAQDSTSYACSLIERRRIPVGVGLYGYTASAPRSVVVTFDSDEARRHVALGKTLYVAGGIPRQYDGSGLSGVGFPLFPYDLSVADSGVAGALVAGTYTWLASLEWPNGQGEVDRSTTALYDDQSIAASRKATVTVSAIPIVDKIGAFPALKIWRSPVDPVLDSPYYLVTSYDPALLSGDNEYLENDPDDTASTSFTDNYTEAFLAERETYLENGGILENLAPTGASIIAASADRIFLAGIPNEPQMVAYSKLRGVDEVAAFNDALSVRVPVTGGAITALAFINDTLVAFQETAIRPLTGFGFDNAGQGSNFAVSSILSGDVGAESADAVAQVPQGILFKSAKGWYLLDRGFSVQYVGGPVADYDSETVLSIDVLESQHQIRALTSSRMLVWDYLVNQWAVWTIASASHAIMHSGVHHYCTSSAVYKQATSWGSNEADYALDVETAWVKLTGLQGYQKVRRVLVLGEYEAAHSLRVRLARNYIDDTYFDDTSWTPSPTTVGGPEQVRHSPTISKVQAIKVRITDVDPGVLSLWQESLKLTGLTIEYGVKRGTFKGLPAAQKQ